MCTNVRLRPADDGTVCVARTMEFPDLIPWSLSVIPAKTSMHASVPDRPLSWTSRHAVVGICGFGNGQWLVDGMNTAGLSAHALYMEGFCHYEAAADDATNLGAIDLIAYLLGTCGTIDEVRSTMATATVVPFDPGMGFPPPLHFGLYDASGAIVIEFRPEGPSVVDNPVGVMTNPPYLDWHLLNLRQYIGLSPSNPSFDFDGTTFRPLGQGGGLRGLPGDYTPPARFVRAFVLQRFMDTPKDSTAAESAALHVLNSFDIPAGIIRESLPDGTIVDEVTSWSTISNLTGRRYAYRSIDDPTVYVVDLSTTDLTRARSAPLGSDARFTPTDP
jgi:choloylglycine hydrolase